MDRMNKKRPKFLRRTACEFHRVGKKGRIQPCFFDFTYKRLIESRKAFIAEKDPQRENKLAWEAFTEGHIAGTRQGLKDFKFVIDLLYRVAYSDSEFAVEAERMYNLVQELLHNTKIKVRYVGSMTKEEYEKIRDKEDKFSDLASFRTGGPAPLADNDDKED